MDYTEDEVRNIALNTLGFKNEEGIKADLGQLTTFKSLGFSCKNDNHKPDGWYLPEKKTDVAIIIELKSSKKNIKDAKWIKELLENIKVAQTKYKNVVGILYNGIDVSVYKNLQLYEDSDTLQNKEYYLSLFNHSTIDKQHIYTVTKRINDSLHINFGIKNLYHRMIFTACALVAVKEGALVSVGMDYNDMHNIILNQINKSLKLSRQQNSKLSLLAEVYSEIKMNNYGNQKAINEFIEDVKDISRSVNSDNWNGEDVMGIFFNEFNRYKKKSDSGQVFTPDHITSFMYRLIDVDKDCYVLDAACGSGGFLVKAMCNMIKEAGGINTNKATIIKQQQLFGIEFDREIYALACANMLIHKDGKTNIEQMDTRTNEACKWIKEKTQAKDKVKVLMNPPFERKYGCKKIVANVLDNVPPGTKCAFILPDRKLEKDNMKGLLNHHCLEKIIKLPEKVFETMPTSIFIFETGKKQNNTEIFACYIEDDGLETVKNQGRQDIKDRWQEIEDKWIDIIHKQTGDKSIQWLKPQEHLSYQMPIPEIKLYEEDFMKTALDYVMFKENINKDKLKDNLLTAILYGKDNI